MEDPPTVSSLTELPAIAEVCKPLVHNSKGIPIFLPGLLSPEKHIVDEISRFSSSPDAESVAMPATRLAPRYLGTGRPEEPKPVVTPSTTDRDKDLDHASAQAPTERVEGVAGSEPPLIPFADFTGQGMITESNSVRVFSIRITNLETDDDLDLLVEGLVLEITPSLPASIDHLRSVGVSLRSDTGNFRLLGQQDEVAPFFSDSGSLMPFDSDLVVGAGSSAVVDILFSFSSEIQVADKQGSFVVNLISVVKPGDPDPSYVVIDPSNPVKSSDTQNVLDVRATMLQMTAIPPSPSDRPDPALHPIPSTQKEFSTLSSGALSGLLITAVDEAGNVDTDESSLIRLEAENPGDLQTIQPSEFMLSMGMASITSSNPLTLQAPREVQDVTLLLLDNDGVVGNPEGIEIPKEGRVEGFRFEDSVVLVVSSQTPSTSPVNRVNPGIQITFSENVSPVVGKYLTLTTLSPVASTASFLVTDPSAFRIEGAVATLLPLFSPLLPGQQYFVLLDDGAFDDSAQHLSSSGVEMLSSPYTSPSDWTFTTADDSGDPSTDVPASVNVILEPTLTGSAGYTSDDTVFFRVLFSQLVEPLSLTSHVQVSSTATLTAATPGLSVLVLGLSYRIAVPDLLNDGDLRLEVVDVGLAADLTMKVSSMDPPDNVFHIDNTPPRITVERFVSKTSRPTVRGTVSEPASLSVTINSQTYQVQTPDACPSGDPCAWSLPGPRLADDLPNGIYDVVATATDKAGNSGRSGGSSEITVRAGIEVPPVSELSLCTGSERTLEDIAVMESAVDDIMGAGGTAGYLELRLSGGFQFLPPSGDSPTLYLQNEIGDDVSDLMLSSSPTLPEMELLRFTLNPNPTIVVLDRIILSNVRIQSPTDGSARSGTLTIQGGGGIAFRGLEQDLSPVLYRIQPSRNLLAFSTGKLITGNPGPDATTVIDDGEGLLKPSLRQVLLIGGLVPGAASSVEIFDSQTPSSTGRIGSVAIPMGADEVVLRLDHLNRSHDIAELNGRPDRFEVGIFESWIFLKTPEGCLSESPSLHKVAILNLRSRLGFQVLPSSASPDIISATHPSNPLDPNPTPYTLQITGSRIATCGSPAPEGCLGNVDIEPLKNAGLANAQELSRITLTMARDGVGSASLSRSYIRRLTPIENPEDPDVREVLCFDDVGRATDLRTSSVEDMKGIYRVKIFPDITGRPGIISELESENLRFYDLVVEVSDQDGTRNRVDPILLSPWTREAGVGVSMETVFQPPVPGIADASTLSTPGLWTLNLEQISDGSKTEYFYIIMRVRDATDSSGTQLQEYSESFKTILPRINTVFSIGESVCAEDGDIGMSTTFAHAGSDLGSPQVISSYQIAPLGTRDPTFLHPHPDNGILFPGTPGRTDAALPDSYRVDANVFNPGEPYRHGPTPLMPIDVSPIGLYRIYVPIEVTDTGCKTIAHSDIDVYSNPIHPVLASASLVNTGELVSSEAYEMYFCSEGRVPAVEADVSPATHCLNSAGAAGELNSANLLTKTEVCRSARWEIQSAEGIERESLGLDIETESVGGFNLRRTLFPGSFSRTVNVDLVTTSFYNAGGAEAHSCESRPRKIDFLRYPPPDTPLLDLPADTRGSPLGSDDGYAFSYCLEDLTMGGENLESLILEAPPPPNTPDPASDFFSVFTGVTLPLSDSDVPVIGYARYTGTQIDLSTPGQRNLFDLTTAVERRRSLYLTYGKWNRKMTDSDSRFPGCRSEAIPVRIHVYPVPEPIQIDRPGSEGQDNYYMCRDEPGNSNFIFPGVALPIVGEIPTIMQGGIAIPDPGAARPQYRWYASNPANPGDSGQFRVADNSGESIVLSDLTGRGVVGAAPTPSGGRAGDIFLVGGRRVPRGEPGRTIGTLVVSPPPPDGLTYSFSFADPSHSGNGTFVISSNELRTANVDTVDSFDIIVTATPQVAGVAGTALTSTFTIQVTDDPIVNLPPGTGIIKIGVEGREVGVFEVSPPPPSNTFYFFRFVNPEDSADGMFAIYTSALRTELLGRFGPVDIKVTTTALIDGSIGPEIISYFTLLVVPLFNPEEPGPTSFWVRRFDSRFDIFNEGCPTPSVEVSLEVFDNPESPVPVGASTEGSDSSDPHFDYQIPICKFDIEQRSSASFDLEVGYEGTNRHRSIWYSHDPDSGDARGEERLLSDLLTNPPGISSSILSVNPSDLGIDTSDSSVSPLLAVVHRSDIIVEDLDGGEVLFGGCDSPVVLVRSGLSANPVPPILTPSSYHQLVAAGDEFRTYRLNFCSNDGLTIPFEVMSESGHNYRWYARSEDRGDSTITPLGTDPSIPPDMVKIIPDTSSGLPNPPPRSLADTPIAPTEPVPGGIPTSPNYYSFFVSAISSATLCESPLTQIRAHIFPNPSSPPVFMEEESDTLVCVFQEAEIRSEVIVQVEEDTRYNYNWYINTNVDPVARAQSSPRYRTGITGVPDENRDVLPLELLPVTTLSVTFLSDSNHLTLRGKEITDLASNQRGGFLGCESEPLMIPVRFVGQPSPPRFVNASNREGLSLYALCADSELNNQQFQIETPNSNFLYDWFRRPQFVPDASSMEAITDRASLTFTDILVDLGVSGARTDYYVFANDTSGGAEGFDCPSDPAQVSFQRTFGPPPSAGEGEPEPRILWQESVPGFGIRFDIMQDNDQIRNDQVFSASLNILDSSMREIFNVLSGESEDRVPLNLAQEGPVFSPTLTIGLPGDYMVTATLKLNSDYCETSESRNLKVHRVVIVDDATPYFEGFETQDHAWVAENRQNDGTESTVRLNSWECGPASQQQVNHTSGGAYHYIPPLAFSDEGRSGSNRNYCATKLDGGYSHGEQSWIYSPVFDIANLSQPTIDFLHIKDFDNSKDGVVFQYASYPRGQGTDGQPPPRWQTVGSLRIVSGVEGLKEPSGIGWYNADNISSSPGSYLIGEDMLSPRLNPSGYGWTTPMREDYEDPGQPRREWEWVRSSHILQISGSRYVQFRFALGAADEDDRPGISPKAGFGFAFDDFKVYNGLGSAFLETFVDLRDGDSKIVLDLLQDSSDRTVSEDRIYFLNFATSLSSADHEDVLPDPLFLRNPLDPETRGGFYAIEKVPTSILNGQVKQADPGVIGNQDLRYLGWTETELERSLLDEPQFEVELEDLSIGEEGALTVRGVFRPLAIFRGVSLLSIRFFVIEKEVALSDIDPEGVTYFRDAVSPVSPNYVLRNLVRAILPNAAGFIVEQDDTSSAAPDLSPLERTVSWNISGLFNPSSLTVIALVQDESLTTPDGPVKKIFGAGRLDIQNKRNSVLRASPEAADPALHVFPTPFYDYFDIRRGGAVGASWGWQVFEASGKLIGGGSSRQGQIRIPTSNWKGGVYILRTTPREETRILVKP